MNSKFRLVTLALFLVAVPALFGQNAHDIVHAHAEAIGGKKAIKAVKTLERTAMVEIGNGQEIPVKFTQKRPLMSRQEIEFQGAKIVQAFDGKITWQVNPLTGSSDPVPMPDVQADVIKRLAYFDDILWENQKLRKVTLDYKGKVEREGRTCHQIGVTFGDGFQQERFYDAETNILLQIDQKAADQTGNLVDTTTTFTDWREVGSVKYPYKLVNSQGQVVTFTDTQINNPVEDALFSMPNKASSP